jgi:His-Xaa-Ser system protein HxsD
MDRSDSTDPKVAPEAIVSVNLGIISAEALLKTCYWLSRDYACDIRMKGGEQAEVVISPKRYTSAAEIAKTRDAFLVSAMDFALRERVEAKTSGVRDLLLAKAFSESGVLEDQPEGIFGDAIEEEKTDGMFKILSNPMR